MTVETRNGGEYFVLLNHCLNNSDVLVSKTGMGWNSLDDLNDDLIFDNGGVQDNPQWDIVKVFKPSFYSRDAEGLDLIWCREENPEYTMEELIERMGHEFKIKK